MKKPTPELVFQVGCVVEDLDAVLNNLKEYFNIEEESIDIKSNKDDEDAGKKLEMLYNGKETKFYFRRARLNFGAIDLEYIEPLNKNGGDPYSDWLKEHGPGIQHINMKLDDRKAFDERMLAEGRPIYCYSGADGLGLEAYDLRDKFGFIAELGDMVVGPRAKEQK